VPAENKKLVSTMENKTDSIPERVYELIDPILRAMDIELVDVEYLTDKGRWVLRVYIDKNGGVTVDDCARVSGEIEYPIDVQDIIKHEYVLEVSSPGLNRPLTKEKDYQRALGKKVKIKMSFPQEGRKNFKGYLKNLDDEYLHLEVNGQLFRLPRHDIMKANLVYDFNKQKV
jgi:ribosome maturation factor RimP